MNTMVDLKEIRQNKLVEKLKTLSYGQDDYLLENNEIIELIDYIEELIEKLNLLMKKK